MLKKPVTPGPGTTKTYQLLGVYYFKGKDTHPFMVLRQIFFGISRAYSVTFP